MYCPKCGTQNEDTVQFCRQCGEQFITAQNNPANIATTSSDSPYRAPRSAVVENSTHDYSDQPMEYIGFWYRVLAYIIDGFITGIAGFIITFIIGLLIGFMMAAGGSSSHSIGIVAKLMGNVISIIIGWLYFGLLESSAWQGSVGKKALGIKVVDQNGQRISFSRATGRYFSKIISALMLCIGFIMVAFTERKQGLHDMIVGTYVVKS